MFVQLYHFQVEEMLRVLSKYFFCLKLNKIGDLVIVTGKESTPSGSFHPNRKPFILYEPLPPLKPYTGGISAELTVDSSPGPQGLTTAQVVASLSSQPQVGARFMTTYHA